jgi:hypothetical protein
MVRFRLWHHQLISGGANVIYNTQKNPPGAGFSFIEKAYARSKMKRVQKL